MPCNPNINLSRRTWEGGGGDSNSISNNSNSNSSVQRKAEIGNRASPSLFSEQQEDPPPKHSIHTTTTNATKFPRSKTSTRTERLLLERQQRKNSNSSSTSTNSINNNSALEDDGDNGANGHMERGDRSPKRDEEEGYSDRPPGATNSRVRQDGRPSKQRLLVVANRLPVSATRKGEDSWSLEISAGGLVSALLGLKQFEAKWIGWAGVNVPDKPGQAALTKALAEKRCIPVFLDEEIVHQYYNGYCNNVLWPLFHYLGLPQEDRLATTRSFQSQFDAYKKANEMFAEVVHSHYKEGDVVWCHDYHLMFLPQCLKARDSNMKVGWFLHTPFPSSEIHRTLPSRSELLRAVLAADLVGFHTYDYARHFVSACTRILGLEGTPEGVEDQGKLTRVAAIVLQERPRVVSSAVGHAWDLPENTFGAAYAKFMGSRNFSPDDRPPVRFMDTEELAYVATRAREIHDFWHVLFNLPTNLLGESALTVVEFQQLYLPMCLLSTIGGSVRMKTKQREHFFKYYFPWAVRAGMSCTDIMSIYYEKHFDEDLELVRNRWGILPAPDIKNLRPPSNS